MGPEGSGFQPVYELINPGQILFETNSPQWDPKVADFSFYIGSYTDSLFTKNTDYCALRKRDSSAGRVHGGIILSRLMGL